PVTVWANQNVEPRALRLFQNDPAVFSASRGRLGGDAPNAHAFDLGGVERRFEFPDFRIDRFDVFTCHDFLLGCCVICDLFSALNVLFNVLSISHTTHLKQVNPLKSTLTSIKLLNPL